MLPERCLSGLLTLAPPPEERDGGGSGTLVFTAQQEEPASNTLPHWPALGPGLLSESVFGGHGDRAMKSLRAGWFGGDGLKERDLRQGQPPLPEPGDWVL